MFRESKAVSHQRGEKKEKEEGRIAQLCWRERKRRRWRDDDFPLESVQYRATMSRVSMHAITSASFWTRYEVPVIIKRRNGKGWEKQRQSSRMRSALEVAFLRRRKQSARNE